MKSFPMFLLCEEADGYLIYYNYENKRLYGCYNLNADTKPDYRILLVQPILVAGAEIFNRWLADSGNLVRWLICAVAILLATISINVFIKKITKGTEETRDRKMEELSEPMPTEWQRYLQLAKEQLKKQVWTDVGLGVGAILSACLFLWKGASVYFLIYIFMYLIFRFCVIAACPVRKYRLIKSGMR
ncbi:MAG: hypothetical protein J5988_00260 [Eubacterium sp.]|nr:hypothetical protein [Eubacterium sp.]